MYYSYNDFLMDLKSLQLDIERKIGIPKSIVCIARGGMTMSHLLALAWDIRSVYVLNAFSYNPNNTQNELILGDLPTINNNEKEILIVDEIIDSGKSLSKILELFKARYPHIKCYSASLFQKQNAIIKADFFVRIASEWIDFFWEVDMLHFNDKTLENPKKLNNAWG